MKTYLKKIFRNQMSLTDNKGKRIGKKVCVTGFILPWEFIKQFEGAEARYYTQMAFCNSKPDMQCWVPKDIIHMWLGRRARSKV